MRATLVIPTLDEEDSIGHVLATFRAAAESANRTLFADDPIEWELIVVDGRSTDHTVERASAEGARIVLEPRRGYGRAYRTGFAAATGEVIATSDGDATYPVDTLPELVAQLEREHLDFLTGNRLAYLAGRAMTTEHRVGNRILNLTLAFLYHRWVVRMPERRLRDSQSGLWVFRRRLLDQAHLTQDGMPMSEEIKIEALVRGFRVAEVPIHYGERWSDPKLSSWRDGWANFRFLFAKRLRLRRELGDATRGRTTGVR
ncbi:MAG: glycosyltransferase family 2 protein [Thermoplasmata archaeon]